MPFCDDRCELDVDPAFFFLFLLKRGSRLEEGILALFSSA